VHYILLLIQIPIKCKFGTCSIHIAYQVKFKFLFIPVWHLFMRDKYNNTMTDCGLYERRGLRWQQLVVCNHQDLPTSEVNNISYSWDVLFRIKYKMSICSFIPVLLLIQIPIKCKFGTCSIHIPYQVKVKFLFIPVWHL
jgi:hypothetical protein